MLKQFQDPPHYLRRITKLIRLHLYHTRGQGDARTGIHSHASAEDHVNRDHRPAAAIPCEKDGTDAPDSTTISATCQNLNAWLRTPNPLGLLGFGFGGLFLDLTYCIFYSRSRQLYVKLLFLCVYMGLRRSLGDQKSFPNGAHQDGTLLCVCAAPVCGVCGFLAYVSNSHSSTFSVPIHLCFKHIFVSLRQGPARRTETTLNI